MGIDKSLTCGCIQDQYDDVSNDHQVSLSNLQGQVIHDTGTIGELKTQSAADAIARLNPHVRCIRLDERFSAEAATSQLAGFDLVIDVLTISIRVTLRPTRRRRRVYHWQPVRSAGLTAP
jgi:molybdopterin/thiamine biosynthesis adenylyltransferase